MVKIVVARYNEDVHWLLPIIRNCVVYNKGSDDLNYINNKFIIKLENFGKEGGTYIKHMQFAYIPLIFPGFLLLICVNRIYPFL